MRVLGLLVGLLSLTPVLADPVQVQGVRLWAAPDNTRVVFDISRPAEHALFSLESPGRLVIDLENAQLDTSLTSLDYAKGLVSGIRSGPREQQNLRLVLDMRGAFKPKSFLLKPNAEYGHRLVIDLFDPGAAKERPQPVHLPDAMRDLIIAIDAGHGGEDPGARGKRGTREKDVVMAIARKLAALIEREPGMQPVMIREGDYYIGLRKRVRIARQHRADLLVSIHADAFRDRSVHGSSVYVVSQRGATSEMARWLADRENAADLAGGVSLDDKDDLLKSVLLDLSQAATVEASLDVGERVLGKLKRVGKTHKSSVQQAGFMVLKAPDIPSILVETAFISNPDEERRLRNPKHQEKLARAILAGIKTYFASHAPPGTLMASREHIIRRGDTLSHIAQRYQVSIRTLRMANSLSSDVLHIGDILKIPAAGDG